jgi:hypothetical protein
LLDCRDFTYTYCTFDFISENIEGKLKIIGFATFDVIISRTEGINGKSKAYDNEIQPNEKLVC